MTRMHTVLALAALSLTAHTANAHDIEGEVSDDRMRELLMTAHARRSNAPRLVAQATARPKSSAAAQASGTPAAAIPFQVFGPGVNTWWDQQYLYVESNGMPAHNMMVGITAWQQQVPLPQDYTGGNAWRIPLHPVVAKQPVSIKGRFLRGAIALAVNGIPIFNPQNNRGEVSQEIGELDQWGGHCGRADDYHYHAAPLHLQSVVGKDKPIAYALDGYPIYGLAEPDGSQPRNLDAFNGHELPGLGYHYHASTKYPYVNGGFHGEVVEREGQVDPQPHAQPVREALPPMRGAKITGFTIQDRRYSLKYDVGGHPGFVNYTLNDDKSVTFEFVDTAGRSSTETYRSRGPRPQRRDEAPPRQAARTSTGLTLTSPALADGDPLPTEFTGDGQGISPPLQWSNVPANTRSFAVIMHHIPGPGTVKWYWTLWNIPASTTSLPKGVKDVGVTGNNCINPRLEYAPPHSKGPGLKQYTLTLYALDTTLNLSRPADVNRDALLKAMEGHILATSELHVTYTKPGGGSEGRGPGNEPPRRGEMRPGGDPPPPPPSAGGPRLIRREAQDKLNLTDDQRRSIEQLESETADKLFRILTPEQRKILDETRPPRPPEPGDRAPQP
jgi:hypothetical protein